MKAVARKRPPVLQGRDLVGRSQCLLNPPRGVGRPVVARAAYSRHSLPLVTITQSVCALASTLTTVARGYSAGVSSVTVLVQVVEVAIPDVGQGSPIGLSGLLGV